MFQRYSEEEKTEVVNSYIVSEESVASIVARTGISRSTIYDWIRKYNDQQSTGKKPLSAREIYLIQAKVKKIENIVHILQNAECSANAPLQEKLAEMEKMYGQYSIHVLCEAFMVPRGTFYNYIYRNKRDNAWFMKRKEELRVTVQQIYDDNNQIFGANKIAAVMKEKGIRVSIEMVRSLMRDMGLLSIRLDAKNLYDKEKQKYKNYLNQKFNPDSPDEVWVSDVTCYRYGEKNYYICAVLDLFARRVIAHKIGVRNSTALAKATFKLAYENRRPNGSLLFHTDRGACFCSNAFRAYLESLHIIQSFSRAHIPYDNSVMESFFSNLKREELYRTKYRSEKEFRTAVDSY